MGRWIGARMVAIPMLVAPMLLSACSGSSPVSTAGRSSASAAAKPGPFLGMCGSVSDAEAARIADLPQAVVILRNPVGCQWVAPGDTADLSFSWYRGSPIGRERALDEATGRDVRGITVGGHPGFSSRDLNNLCEVGVALGDDFFLWSIRYLVAPAGTSVCDVATQLAGLTVERAS